MTEQQAGVPAVPGVTAEALRAYMTATGWTEPSHEGGPAGKIWSKGAASFGVPHVEDPAILRGAIERLSWAEGRPVGQTLGAVAEHARAARIDAEPSRAESPAPVPAEPGAASTGAAGALPVAAVLDPGVRERLEAALDASIDGCARCKVCDTQIGAAMTVLGPLLARAEAAEAKLLEYEGAITWGTSCLSCSAVLDRSIAEHERAERAEAKLADIRGFLRDTMADPESSAIEATAAMAILAITGKGPDHA